MSRHDSSLSYKTMCEPGYSSLHCARHCVSVRIFPYFLQVLIARGKFFTPCGTILFEVHNHLISDFFYATCSSFSKCVAIVSMSLSDILPAESKVWPWVQGSAIKGVIGIKLSP